MRHPRIFTAILAAVFLSGSAGSALAKGIDPATCHLKALVTDDNDIRIEDDTRPPGKPVPVPAPVGRELQAVASKLVAKLDSELREELTCRNLFPDIYRIAVSEHLQLYVAEIDMSLGARYQCLLLYDPSSGRVTRDPQLIYSQWTWEAGLGDGLLEAPLVSSADLFRNHRPQIVVEDYFHNGTNSDSVIYHYFDVGRDLSLTRVFARETRVPMITPRGDTLLREITQLSPTRLRLDVYQISDSQPDLRRSIGYVIFESPGPGRPFHVVQRHALDASRSWELVTSRDRPENASDDEFVAGQGPYY